MSRVEEILASVFSDPKNIEGNLVRITPDDRLLLLSLAASDQGFRKVFNLCCTLSFPFFVSNCLFVNEPRNDSGLTDLPFILRSFQWDVAGLMQDALDNERSLLIDKTREMGVTWLMIAMFVWGWLFKMRFTALVGSITEDKIDSKNNPNALFWKADYLIASLLWQASWLFPEGYGKSKDHRSHMKVFNPQTLSSIIGETMGPNFGRSGRVRAILCDEFAEAINPSSTWAACSRTSNTRFIVFTPKGMNFAGRLANPGNGKQRTIDRISLHWLIDETKNHFQVHKIMPDGKRFLLGSGHGVVSPLKRQKWIDKAIDEEQGEKLDIYYPWYEQAKVGLGHIPLLIAQELDINYNESAEGRMYPQIERAKFSDIDYNPYLKLYCCMDYGYNDNTALIWFQIDPSDARYPFKIIDAYQSNAKTIKWYVPFITGRDTYAGEPEGGYTELEEDIIKEHRRYMFRYAGFFGDPAGKQKTVVSNQSAIDVLATFGIYVTTNEKARGFEPRLQAVAESLPFCEFNENKCSDLIQAIRDSRTNPQGKPVHGPESHYRSALEYGFVNLPGGFINPDMLLYEQLGPISSEVLSKSQIEERAIKRMNQKLFAEETPGFKSFPRGKTPKVMTVQEFSEGRVSMDENNPYKILDEIREKMKKAEERQGKILEFQRKIRRK